MRPEVRHIHLHPERTKGSKENSVLRERRKGEVAACTDVVYGGEAGRRRSSGSGGGHSIARPSSTAYFSHGSAIASPVEDLWDDGPRGVPGFPPLAILVSRNARTGPETPPPQPRACSVKEDSRVESFLKL